MSRPATFKQIDFTRSFKGAVAAGIPFRLEVYPAIGKIVIIPQDSETTSELPVDEIPDLLTK